MFLLGTGTMVADLRQVGTTACRKKRLKMVVNASVSWSVQGLSIRAGTPSGP